MSKHLHGPSRAPMLALESQGFDVREVWLTNTYYDGMIATKRAGPHCIEVYMGNADDGEHGDLHYQPGVYLNGLLVARLVESVEKAARIANFRALMCKTGIAKATGAAS